MILKHWEHHSLVAISFAAFYYCSLTVALSQTPAFPGAEGFGRYVTGGRGGRVIAVTNVNGDASPGSLRAALSTPGTDPITIVFHVSGIIAFDTSVVKVGRSNMTIAGQTAPGDGICIRKGRLYFYGSNFIIRYVRFRIGDEFKLSLAALDIENAKNFIVDHCSLSWSVEENFTCYDNRLSTVQWSILSEGLYQSYNSKGARSYGSQWGGQFASYHHNLFAHDVSRSPRVNGCRAHDTTALCDYRNNVIFNWGSSGAIYGGEVEIADTNTPGKARANINWVNNYYKPGPATPSTKYFAQPSFESSTGAGKGYGKWFVSGNFMEGVTGGMNDDNWAGVNVSKVGSAGNIRSDTVFAVEAVSTETAAEAFQSVVAGAGAILPKRDPVDSRIVAEIKGEVAITGSGVFGANKGIIDSQDSLGGWPAYASLTPPVDTDHDGLPDEWERAHGLNPADSTDGAVITADGYSNLEHYLNSIAAATTAVEPGSPVTPQEYRLECAYPNPFNPTTKIGFRVSGPGSRNVRLVVYDILGRELAVLMDERKEPGEYAVQFDGSGLSSGVYYCRMRAGDYIQTRKMILLK